MNNADLFFPHEEHDDLQDLYEERLFVDKQFFTSRAIIPSMFEKRFSKLSTREEAYREISKTETPEVVVPVFTPKNSTSIFEAYSQFQVEKAHLYQSIFQVQNIPTLIVLVRQLMEAYIVYSAHFWLNETFITKDILISKEPEPVLLSMAIQSFDKAGGKMIEDLHDLTFNGKETLLNEAKRLSLWRKKEIDNGNF